jgi:hypothetical protein
MVRVSRHPDKERNPMRKSLAPIAITAAIAGGAGALAFGPAFAGAQTDPSASSDSTTQDDATTGKVGPLEEALAGLVEDGTLTQEQADAVKERLVDALPRGGRHLRALVEIGEDVADYLGLGLDDLREALRDGTTLAELAEQQGKDVDGLVDVIVAQSTERIDEAVADGKLTEERAAEVKENLEARVTELVENGGPRFRHGPGGHGPRFRWDGPHDDGDTEDEAEGTGTAA